MLNYSLQEGTAKPQNTSIPNVGKSSLSSSGELHKKPAPNKNTGRNTGRPSQGHLEKLAVQSEDGKELTFDIDYYEGIEHMLNLTI